MAVKPLACDEIKRELKARILSGALPEGSRVPSEYELVRQLGVSRNRTRQALRELELEGLVVRRQGSGSYVAPGATRRGDRTATPALDTVKIAFPEYGSYYTRQIIEGFMARMFEEGMKVTTYNVQFDAARESEFLNEVDRAGLAGLVIWLGNEDNRVRDALLRLREVGFPVVLADRHYPDVDTDFVVSDNREIGRALTRALIARGHRRLAFVNSSYDLASSAADRLAGFRDALAEAGLGCGEESVVAVGQLGEDTRQAVCGLMARHERPTAFVCVNDTTVEWVWAELERLGWPLPDSVEIASVDDGSPGNGGGVPMVATMQQGLQIGCLCAELLSARLRDRDRPTEHRIVPSSPVYHRGLGPVWRGAGREGG